MTTATKLANAMTTLLTNKGHLCNSIIETAIDLSTNTPAARVVQYDGVVLLDWICATAETVRSAEQIFREKINELNDQFDAEYEN